MWDHIDAGNHTGAMKVGLNLNNRDSKLRLSADGGRIRARRPRSDLVIHAVFPFDIVFDCSEEARLHHAYHIYPDQPVQGAPGTATRLDYRIGHGAKRIDLVTLFFPLRTGAEAPAVAAEPTGAAHVMETLSLTVGEDRFDLGQNPSVTISAGGTYRF
jgi:hypothetical protein